MNRVEEENMKKLLKDRDDKMKELNILKNTSIEKMWLTEINELETNFNKYKLLRKSRQFGIKIKKSKNKKTIKK